MEYCELKSGVAAVRVTFTVPLPVRVPVPLTTTDADGLRAGVGDRQNVIRRCLDGLRPGKSIVDRVAYGGSVKIREPYGPSKIDNQGVAGAVGQRAPSGEGRRHCQRSVVLIGSSD